MARTGSGKTAAFLIPLCQLLKEHNDNYIRACIISPTRELAEQITRVLNILSHFLGLRTCCLVGGISLASQYERISQKPDIIIATPGRLAHHHS